MRSALRRLAPFLALALMPWAAASAPPLHLAPLHVPAISEVAGRVAAAQAHPRQFAVALPAALGTEHGQWFEAENGPVWALRLHSPGARSLALRLEGLDLPEGAQLVWQTPDGATGFAYRAKGDGLWWTPELPGDWGLLSLSVPGRDAPPRFAIAEVFHGFRSPEEAAKRSGSCNVDVACPQGAPWRNEVAATVRLTIANQFLCSGVMVDNSARDGRPLLLSARHCGLSPETARSVIALFDFERSGCGAGDPNPAPQRVEGSRWLAESEAADTTLLELLEPPPGTALRGAGWDARPPMEAVPGSGAGLHHPSGDFKKISLFESPARAVEGVRIGNGEGGFTVDAWSLVWTQGTTEGGSSGSALFNERREVVGVLSGGSASCSNREGRDFYGRLDRAFETSPALAQALDPVQGGRLLRLEPRPDPTTHRAGLGGELPQLQNAGSVGVGVLLALAFASLIRRRRR